MHGTYGVDLRYPSASAAATVGYFRATPRASVCCWISASRSAWSTGYWYSGPRWSWPSASFETWPTDAGGPDFSHGESPVSAPPIVLIVPTASAALPFFPL